ncbi:hypothetical protein ACFLXQ_06170 [Chloroflexota bacterium]
MDTSAYQIFFEFGRDFRTRYTDLIIDESKDETQNSASLEVTSQSPNGFDVTIEIREGKVFLWTNTGFHDEWQIDDDHNSFMKSVFGFLRDLLSNNMRLRELRSNGQPYRWVLEGWNGKDWIMESTTGLIIYNYFGRKSEHIFQNQMIEGLSIDSQ